uniref:Uncharacterized protein n=1 Tax=Schistocephalus solidus TaxID=70667 RepID=A0A0X3PK61_SCHSO
MTSWRMYLYILRQSDRMCNEDCLTGKGDVMGGTSCRNRWAVLHTSTTKKYNLLVFSLNGLAVFQRYVLFIVMFSSMHLYILSCNTYSISYARFKSICPVNLMLFMLPIYASYFPIYASSVTCYFYVQRPII